MLRVIVDVLKVNAGIVTEVPLSMLTVVKSVTLSRKTIGGRKEEVESAGITVVVFEFVVVVVDVVDKESVVIEEFFMSSTFKVEGTDESVADCVVGGALVDVLVGAFVTIVVGAFVGFFVAGLRVGVAAAVVGVVGAVVGVVAASVGEVTSSVICSFVLDDIAGLSVEKYWLETLLT